MHPAGAGAGGSSDVDAATVGEGLGWKRLLDGELKGLVEEERLFLANALALLEKACPQVRGARTTASRPLPTAQQCNVHSMPRGMYVLPGLTKLHHYCASCPHLLPQISDRRLFFDL